MPSRMIAEQFPTALVTLLVDEIGNRGIHGRTRTIHPNPELLMKAWSDANREEDNAIILALNFKSVARTEPKGGADRFWQD